jgi:uncharacterized protein (TIGR00288 family)
MLLIDADNVSIDVMEQAVRLLLNQHGALHVRRAYCTAESAVANQATFKRLGIKPMVNLAAGKNSTDIAMAVDAIDLVLAERPDVVVIASSDSDFAPLVQRLREKGCVVRGIGQMGKTGDETQEVYDDYTVLEHRKSAASAVAKPARKTAARKAAVKTAAAKKAPAAKKAAARSAAAKAPARKTAPRKVATALAAAAAPAPQSVLEVLPSPLPPAPAAPLRATQPAAQPAPQPAPQREAASRRGRGGGATSIDAVLDCLPELAGGQSLALNVAVQRLREAQLLGKNSSSLKLFAQWSDRFDLLPAGNPTQVRLHR